MAVASIPTTTLSSALTATQLNVPVASAASITTSMILVIRNEVLKVQSVDTTNNVVYCRRGSNGSQPFAQPSGALVYYATPETWQTLRTQAMSIVGDSSTLPQYLMPGARATDGAGNEYVLIDLTFSAYKGVAVLISPDGLYTGKALASGDVGSVGIVAEEATSNQFAWAQIYGKFSAAQFTSGSSLATSTGLIEPATTASTPAGGLLARTTSQASSLAFARILGMKLTSAITTGTTAATSATGFVGDVWMSYPYLEHDVTSA